MEVLALVGPSGTGKSHRAMMVAHQYDAEIIIDDGLIIKGNRILAGNSAKRQPTRIGAIKTALFMDDDHAEQAIQVLRTLQPKRVLILGTSEAMVKKIAKRLELPPVKMTIRIEDVASVKEIRKARLMRSQYSKHVIPAPTVEVKKSFPESLITPLQIFLGLKSTSGKKNWHEQSVVKATFTHYGHMSITQHALSSIIKRAALEVEGVAGVPKISIHREEQNISIDISLTATYGLQLNTLAQKVQIRVKEQVEKMTGLQINAINVTITGIKK